MMDRLYRVLKAKRNYANPLSMAWDRARKAAIVRVEDRVTGLKFNCRRGADQMMAETFPANIYNIPFVPINRGDVVLDIGANHGFYSCWAAHQGATVHAFEPDPNTYDLLVQNIALNNLQDRIMPHQCAIAAETGDLQMFCTPDLGGGMSTVIPAFAVKTGLNVTSQSTVKALSLADALNECGTPHVRICKMDCEGAEYSVLSGLDRDTLNTFDSFVLEYHPQAYKLDDFLNVLLAWDGFHISKVVSQDRELGNANLSIVRDDLIREWCKAAPVETKARPSEVLAENHAVASS